MSSASIVRGAGKPPAKRTRKPKTEQGAEREQSEVVPLKERHKMVVDAVMQGYSESDAMRAAGYHPSSGANVMRGEEIQSMLAEARAEMSDASSMKRVDVMNLFIEAIDMARTLADPAQMINGADKIAKMMGYYAPEVKKIELTTDQNALQSKYRQMTDEQLFELAANGARVVNGEVLK